MGASRLATAGAIHGNRLTGPPLEAEEGTRNMKLLPEGRARTGQAPKPKKKRIREPWEAVFGLIFLFLGLNLMSIGPTSKSPSIVSLLGVLCFLLAAYLLPKDRSEGESPDDTDSKS